MKNYISLHSKFSTASSEHTTKAPSYFLLLYQNIPQINRDQTSNKKITSEIFNRYLIGNFPQISYSLLVPSPHNFDVTHLLKFQLI